VALKKQERNACKGTTAKLSMEAAKTAFLTQNSQKNKLLPFLEFLREGGNLFFVKSITLSKLSVTGINAGSIKTLADMCDNRIKLRLA